MTCAKILCLLSLFTGSALAQPPHQPFPWHASYSTGSIKPDQYKQAQLDEQVKHFYNQWKKRYIKQGCNAGEYYVWFERQGNKQCVSEGQGYGMIITAYLAGADAEAQMVFDGLYGYVKHHPAKTSPGLMAWAQDKNCRDLDKSTASDGDIDIAFSLLLANKQWGSSGAINYLKEARNMINAIMQYEINPKTFSVLLSDAVEHDSKDYFDTRSSDFMPDHFKAFLKVSKDVRWQKVIDEGYQLFAGLERRYSPEAGLVPDFIRHVDKTPTPAQALYLESPYDGVYNYNACRLPWRIGTDYLLYDDKRAKAITGKINKWLKLTTRGDPDNISAGYTLAGNDLKGRYFEALSFIGPFAVAAMTEDGSQGWLNKVYDYLLKFKLKDFDYYDNSIKMLNMIVLTGNYWEP